MHIDQKDSANQLIVEDQGKIYFIQFAEGEAYTHEICLEDQSDSQEIAFKNAILRDITVSGFENTLGEAGVSLSEFFGFSTAEKYYWVKSHIDDFKCLFPKEFDEQPKTRLTHVIDDLFRVGIVAHGGSRSINCIVDDLRVTKIVCRANIESVGADTWVSVEGAGEVRVGSTRIGTFDCDLVLRNSENDEIPPYVIGIDY